MCFHSNGTGKCRAGNWVMGGSASSSSHTLFALWGCEICTIELEIICCQCYWFTISFTTDTLEIYLVTSERILWAVTSVVYYECMSVCLFSAKLSLSFNVLSRFHHLWPCGYSNWSWSHMDTGNIWIGLYIMYFHIIVRVIYDAQLCCQHYVAIKSHFSRSDISNVRMTYKSDSSHNNFTWTCPHLNGYKDKSFQENVMFFEILQIDSLTPLCHKRNWIDVF